MFSPTVHVYKRQVRALVAPYTLASSTPVATCMTSAPISARKSPLEIWRFVVLCITSVLSPRVQMKTITRGATLETTNVHVVNTIRLQLTKNGFKRIAPMTGSWNDEESIEWPMDVAITVIYLKKFQYTSWLGQTTKDVWKQYWAVETSRVNQDCFYECLNFSTIMSHSFLLNLCPPSILTQIHKKMLPWLYFLPNSHYVAKCRPENNSIVWEDFFNTDCIWP